ncbi:MAG: alanine--tRNA ligase [Nitrospirae bacterium CG_4_10_14_0_8_um_filter_41_23]|nr:alanine--tRNA ligase [Nitrospirota bacterium]OIP61089.1 MAG: alanine--tRNA ligase [Nitrospirae bacterium CG2_30_41_42]PIQ94867.1 MAG: alanine--tRNA ligase [Nitrospirae bacterium CG11_big_fil_rev_8_21_14_0_20_41_14]PIV40977.1 MAG: alanine--tRNA ligase [Nitrospirae bacterium CG02_land_8_20_14_3_00_41_53]PIW88050.1 MAG: alanine--tRNA ligase [Nitrospirae bacterium CG_4_8_14_3_um_filter_41_47]PIY86028.1 MAG: alanine--tRNA ligase [Nitrospirae bacterium CG_4_10_14_0_8_um_filter_41_23]PJA79009.1 M
MKSLEIRTAFLEYFKSKGHKIFPSSPLIPWNDPTLLFVNAGMVRFKTIFLGEEKSPYKRAVSCQKCMRAGGKHSDLENVGHTTRHHTFFEMLGNFSFGDYFKKDAILFSWELLTEWFKLPEEKLYISIYEKDDEAAKLWSELIGLPDERIARLGAKDNFWQMGDTGPCGPCSEIIIDQGRDIGCGRPECAVGCDCDRFLELWNLVFMQFNRDKNGELTPLPKPSIDTGMGLERISAVLQGKTSNFNSDLFEPIIKDISALSNVKYGLLRETDVSIRVIADHIRATIFLLSEGLVPSNEGRGYVLRRLIRRASRHARLLTMHGPCLHKLIDSVINVMGDIYPEIADERKRTEKLLKIEEEQYMKIDEQGLTAEKISKLKKKGENVFPGEVAFRLYDSRGVHPDSIREMVIDAGLKFDEEGFQREMELQKKRSKEGRIDITLPSIKVKMREHAQSEFVGYYSLKAEAVIVDIFKNDGLVNELTEGDEGEVILDRTPFYGESGGQVGDTGTIESEGSYIKVLDTKKPYPHLYFHYVKIEKGKITKGDKVTCLVDTDRRRAIMRNHTATHLLHKALRIVLGDHVKQSGSVVSPERLRFDFTHFDAMQYDEIKRTEDLINEKILEDLPVETDIMKIDEATKTGAVALFGEKYGETVRVVSVDDFSKELCGGTHCKATGEIGPCVILSEGSVASGIRRIEAMTGKSAFDYLKHKETELDSIKGLLKSERPLEKVEKLLNDMKSMEKEIQKLKTGSTKDTISKALKEAHEFDGVKVVKIRQDGLNPTELRLLADNIKERLKSGIIVVSSVIDSQAAIVCMVTKDLKDRYNAGEIVKSISIIAGGKGGGKPEMAQGGTKDIEKLDNALEALYDIIKRH